MSDPVLYSFRRCPYAIRARLAVYHSGVRCELREVVLRNKPAAMLAASPKATVPVLVLPDRVIDESLDVMSWALSQTPIDPVDDLNADWQPSQLQHDLIVRNDGYFKSWLDKYKYFDRFPEGKQSDYFEKAVSFLCELETALVPNHHEGWALLTPGFSAVDAAIFPFVRQFAFVDKPGFDQLPLPKLLYWLEACLMSPLFSAVMHKYPAWSPQDAEVVIFGKN